MMREFSLLSLWLCSVIKYSIKLYYRELKERTWHILGKRKHFISLCGYKHLWRALVHIRVCLRKETGTYTLSSERIIETEGENKYPASLRSISAVFQPPQKLLCSFPVPTFQKPLFVYLSLSAEYLSLQWVHKGWQFWHYSLNTEHRERERETTHSAEY